MKYLCTLICAMLLMMEGNAKLLRVGFSGVPAVTGVDYKRFFDAYQASENGDSIYVWPGYALGSTGWPTDYWGSAIVTIIKKLTIISKGFWLDSTSYPKGNPVFQASMGAGNLNSLSVTFDIGSEGSTLMGFEGNEKAVVIKANNITIRRNANLKIYLPSANVDKLIVEGNYKVWFEGTNDIGNTFSNLTIRNNFIHQLVLPQKTYIGSITNNIMAFDNLTSTNGGAYWLSYYGGYGNEIEFNLQQGTWLFENNIIAYFTNANPAQNGNAFEFWGTTGTTFNNNIGIKNGGFNWPISGTGNVMIEPSQVADIFEAFPSIANSTGDGRFRLKANSPAKAGSSLRPLATVDAGMFGGNNPYKLSTIPSIPTIYNINSPTGNTATGNSIQINISTRSNN